MRRRKTITPNKIKIMLDKNSIVDVETLEPNHFPKKIAIESLATIPQIEPHIKGTLKSGYSMPRPIEAKNVLSPSSPIAIVEATINIQFLVRECKNLIKLDFGLLLLDCSSEADLFNFIKPIIPNTTKVK